MLVRSYKIVDVKRFEAYIEDVSPKDGEAVVRIDKCAICKADLRYYLGNRDQKTLGLKYPVRLIHEAVGTVLRDSSGKFAPGCAVALVPNVCPEGCGEKGKCRYIRANSALDNLGANYCPRAVFASSGSDGFSSEVIVFPVSNLIPLENPFDAFVFCELVSVAVAAARRLVLNDKSCAAVFGDGVLGYTMCAVLKELYGCTVYAAGNHLEKLSVFEAAKVCDGIFPAGRHHELTDVFGVAFECVGGVSAQGAINSIIDAALPGAGIVLTGVSEGLVPVSTRKILEKGLILSGTTRSDIVDFKVAVSLIQIANFREKIERLILGRFDIRGIDGYYRAFEAEALNMRLGKYLLDFG